jgi:uncharacterized membrane protein YqjE
MIVTQDGAKAPSLAELGRRLARDVARLLDQHVVLMRLELQHGAVELSKSLAFVLGAALGVTVGILFALLALGLWIGTLLGSTAAGLLIVGGALVLSGSALGVVGSRRLQRLRLMPDITRELRRDAAWIQHEM